MPEPKGRVLKRRQIVSEDGRTRVKLVLYKSDDGWYRWYERTQEGLKDVGLMGKDKDAAVELVDEITTPAEI